MTARALCGHAIVALGCIVACSSHDVDPQPGSNAEADESETSRSADEPSDVTEEEESPTAESEFPRELLPEALAPDLPLIPPKSDGDLVMFTPIIELEPGNDVTYCTFTDVILDEPTVFGQSFGSQSTYGHHAVLQYVTEPQEPGTRPCRGEGGGEMEFNLLLGGSGGEAADEQYLPDNVGMEIPAGAQFVINHHWIHYGTETAEAQAMMVARRTPITDDVVLAGMMIMLGFGWEVAPGSSATFATECTYPRDVSFLQSAGHMHEWGTHVSVEVLRKEGGMDTLVDTPWDAEKATGVDAFGEVFQPDDPFVVRAGDTVRLTCNWNNDTVEPLIWPREMCIHIGYTVGGGAFCANGNWFDREATAEETGH